MNTQNKQTYVARHVNLQLRECHIGECVSAARDAFQDTLSPARRPEWVSVSQVQRDNGIHKVRAEKLLCGTVSS